MNVKTVPLMFEELFTDINRDEYKKAFSQPYVDILQFVINIPVSLLKESEFNVVDICATESVPFAYKVNLRELSSRVINTVENKEDISEIIERSCDKAFDYQCKMVQQLFKIH